jgi:hypothetical protein
MGKSLTTLAAKEHDWLTVFSATSCGVILLIIMAEHTSTLKHNVDIAAAAAAAAGVLLLLPDDTKRRRASIMPQRVLQPEAFDHHQQQQQQPSSAAAPPAASSSRAGVAVGTSGAAAGAGQGSQRTGSSRSGRPSLATNAFKVPAAPVHQEASATRLAAESSSSSHYVAGLSAGALRAQEQQRMAAAAAAAAGGEGGGSLPPSRPPTASSEGHCPSERSYVTTTSHAGPYGRHYVHGSPAAAGPRSVGVARAVSAVLTNPRDWSSRVAAFELLSDALQQQVRSWRRVEGGRGCSSSRCDQAGSCHWFTQACCACSVWSCVPCHWFIPDCTA